jgi:hypothetical protein
MMTPSLRKLVLTAHITVSVGWLGAVAASSLRPLEIKTHSPMRTVLCVRWR